MKNKSPITKPAKTTSHAHASLALVKYWGKQNQKQSHLVNLSECTNIAVTLKGLDSSLRAIKTPCDIKKNKTPTQHLSVNGKTQDISRMQDLLNAFTKQHKANIQDFNFLIKAKNSFPSSAGLASSASGGAALTLGLADLLDLSLSQQQLSCLSRVYSGSACRSIFGGFVEWKKGKTHANSFAPKNHWGNFRVIVVAITTQTKKYSSRQAMIHTKNTSPYYTSWIKYNNALSGDAKKAIIDKDIQKLGEIAVRSYTAMHASALSAYPSILYWQKDTITILQAVQKLQKNNIAVWETMDAGPQIKLLTLSKHVKKITAHIRSCVPSAWIKTCTVGGDATLAKNE